ncbi:hypothetical protein HZB01_02745 [Candidatus Woesearchaeota archaeon]|nr:hypothetical protein [Candidatus Woesearchaeota archaeon]
MTVPTSGGPSSNGKQPYNMTPDRLVALLGYVHSSGATYKPKELGSFLNTYDKAVAFAQSAGLLEQITESQYQANVQKTEELAALSARLKKVDDPHEEYNNALAAYNQLSRFHPFLRKEAWSKAEEAKIKYEAASAKEPQLGRLRLEIQAMEDKVLEGGFVPYGSAHLHLTAGARTLLSYTSTPESLTGEKSDYKDFTGYDVFKKFVLGNVQSHYDALRAEVEAEKRDRDAVTRNLFSIASSQTRTTDTLNALFKKIQVLLPPASAEPVAVKATQHQT